MLNSPTCLCALVEVNSINEYVTALSSLHRIMSAVLVRRKHDSIEVMKHILRDGGGLKAAETKHAGSRLAMQAGGWQSFNPHPGADKSAREFHFYPPYQFAWPLSDEQTPTCL